ncbi:MAG: glutamine synthetase [Spirochaetes bacterium]|nr:glutamine synthetase [Spirochaetota bacterium]
MLTLTQLDEKIRSGEIETVIAAFPDLYGRLFGKRIAPDFFLGHVAKTGMHACNYLFTVDMPMNPVPGYRYANWNTGYGDFHCVPDMATLRHASWLDKTALVICDIYDEHGDSLTAVAPRSILKKQVAAASSLGFLPMGAAELEYYIFKESYEEAGSKKHHGLEPFGSYIEDYHILQGTREEPLNAAVRRHLANSGVPVEFSKGEWGPGQHELNTRYADVLTMADNQMVYKQCFKEVADALGISVTFMAKFDENLAGSSCHMHLSLWDPAGKKSLFAGREKIGPVAGSDLFRWFLGGWIGHAAEMMPFYAPTVNSYKRYQAGSWAPTALAWSYDNRTAGFRIVGGGESLRIESRIPGADINPYLGFAAALASGLDGIRNRIEPPPLYEGDMYSATSLPRVPATLRDAIAALEESAFAREAFGNDVIEHYLHFYKTEQQSFDRAVTDWERARYFEQI